MPRHSHAHSHARRYSVSVLALLSCWLAVPLAARADATLVPTGASFRYLADGTNQGTAWRAPAFSDSAWPQGPAQLGYGDGDEATVVPYGPNSSAKYPTTYFRRSFSVADPSAFTGLTLRVLRDDGAVVYVNGVEVFRTNMPSGSIAYTTWASTALGGVDETTYLSTSVASSLLQAGQNVIAVEVHQSGGTSSDVSFDLELIGVTAPASYSVVRGPYLQQGTSSAMRVRWRTNAATDSVVWFGSSPSQLTQSVSSATSTTEHELALTGLSAGTRHYYAVGSSAEVLSGADADTFFETSPAVGSNGPTRIWVIGDSGTADANATAVYGAYRTFNGSAYTDLWLMLGDNAYDSGTDAEYQDAVFDTYPELLRQTPLWPTLGNHDAATANSATESGPYYDIFSLPRAAEAGGVASGTEAYYSFDYANVHFVVLDSQESSRSPSSAMLTWLVADLQAAEAEWLIAFWHHPPYSKGSHDSDTESQLVDMRQNALPILESYGVDLVLTGHSHSYERSFLLDGHYGSSGTLLGNHIVDGGDGRVDGDGAYHKPTAGLSAREGAVYVVAGSSGKLESGPLNHPAMFVSLSQLGSMVLDVDGLALTARFVNASGAVADHFQLVKGPQSCTPSESPELTCSDGTDNDCDGAEDCDDADCGSLPVCNVPEPRTVTLTAVHDAFVRANKRTTNYGNGTALEVDTGSGRETTYVRPTNLGDITPGAQVLSAYLALTVNGTGSAVSVREVLGDWSEGTITWNTQPAASTTAEATFSPSVTGEVRVDVTGLAQSWVDGTPARGVQLYATGSNGVEMRSSEHSVATARPRFVLEVLE